MSLFGKLFGKSSAQSLSAQQEMLFTNARTTVENYLRANKPFPLFAVALKRSGEIESFLPSDEFGDERAKVVGLLQTLIPLARSRQITAAVIVTPIEAPPGFADASAMYDLEEADGHRFLGVMPYRFGNDGVEFGQMTFKSAPGKLFAA